MEHGDASRGRRRSPWLIPGIVAVGLAAVIGGALLAVAISGSRETASSQDPSASSANGSASSSVSGPPTASPSPTAIAIPVIANRAIVAVIADGLDLRASASESADSYGVVGAGAHLFIIGEPEDAGEQRWYRVAVVAGPYTGSENCQANCPPIIGWVPSPTTGEEALIEEVEVECPSSPMTVQQLDALAPLERLHCYGSQEITGTGTIDLCFCDYNGPITYTPQWLALPIAPRTFRDATNALAFRASPDSDLELPERGDVIRFTGHFEDPAAPSCRARVADPAVSGEGLPYPAELVLTCRATLVVTDYEVTGTEDLGTPG